MPERLDYPTGDLENGQNVQLKSLNGLSFPTKPADISYQQSEAITVSTTAVGLGSVRSGKNYAFITVETDSVRYLFDTAPTSSVGHQLLAGDILELETETELNDVRFIRSGSSDATLQVSYGVRE